MASRSFLAAAILLVSAPHLEAQSPSWATDRPDGVAPAGVFGDRNLRAGTFEASIQYLRTPMDGIRFGDVDVDPLTLFDQFEIVPLTLTTDGYYLRTALGLTDGLTLAARVGFLTRKREQINEDLTYFVLESQGVSDVEVQALWGVYDQDGVRAHLHTGVSIPSGAVSASDGVADLRLDGTLPYDMQLGAGAWGVSPGLTTQIMNESGLVGAQVVATVYFLEKDDWRQGNRIEASGWAAHKLNRFFSASARVNVISFEAIEGFDPDLVPSRDPGELPIAFGGTRVTLPLGVNLYMPEGRWQGHRLSLEFNFPIHERYDGHWLASRRSATVGWHLTF